MYINDNLTRWQIIKQPTSERWDPFGKKNDKVCFFKSVFFSCRCGAHAGDPGGELRNQRRDPEGPPGADGLGPRTHGSRPVPHVHRTPGRVRRELPPHADHAGLHGYSAL